MAAITVTRSISIDDSEIVETTTRAGGPGGQHVNTADSRVQLSLDLATTTALDEPQRTRALQALAARLSGSVLTVAVEQNRSQRRNRATARQRLADLLRDAVPDALPAAVVAAALAGRDAEGELREAATALARRIRAAEGLAGPGCDGGDRTPA